MIRWEVGISTKINFIAANHGLRVDLDRHYYLWDFVILHIWWFNYNILYYTKNKIFLIKTIIFIALKQNYFYFCLTMPFSSYLCPNHSIFFTKLKIKVLILDSFYFCFCLWIFYYVINLSKISSNPNNARISNTRFPFRYFFFYSKLLIKYHKCLTPFLFSNIIYCKIYNSLSQSDGLK